MASASTLAAHSPQTPARPLLFAAHGPDFQADRSSDAGPRGEDLRLRSGRRALLWNFLPTLVASVGLIAHARWFDFVNDDAYISFRYAKNLAEHGQLVFNLGERVEGFTNFLWTVMLAAGMKLGLAPEGLSRALGTAFGVATLFVVAHAGRMLDGGRPRAAHAIAPIGLAATSAYACWCTGGLETQLFTFLVTLASCLLLVEMDRGRGSASGAVFALAAMTRPEGLLFFGLAGLFRAVTVGVRHRRLPLARPEWVWAGLFAVVFVPYFAWRWRYYGWPFPNTFYVKSSGGTGTLAYGAYYLRRLAEDHALWFIVPLVVVGWPRGEDRRRQALYAYTSFVVLTFFAYVGKVGGDFMGLYRFVLPVFPLGALLVQESLRRLAARLSPLVPAPALGLAALGLAGGYGAAAFHTSRTAMTVIGADHGIDSPGYLKRYADERIPIGRWFAQHARPDDLMTVGGAGVIPYESGIRAYDVFGLVDETIAHDPTMTVADRPGHQKWGSDAYMLSRRPTLITHIYRLHERHASDVPMWASRGYEWVTAEIPGLDGPPTYSFLKRLDRSFGPFPARVVNSATYNP